MAKKNMYEIILTPIDKRIEEDLRLLRQQEAREAEECGVKQELDINNNKQVIQEKRNFENLKSEPVKPPAISIEEWKRISPSRKKRWDKLRRVGNYTTRDFYKTDLRNEEPTSHDKIKRENISVLLFDIINTQLISISIILLSIGMISNVKVKRI